jgi:hypothetical protein
MNQFLAHTPTSTALTFFVGGVAFGAALVVTSLVIRAFVRRAAGNRGGERARAEARR